MAQKPNIWYCLNTEIFEKVSDFSMEKAAAQMKQRTLRKKECMLVKDAEHVILVAEGAVKICRSNWFGKDVIEALLFEGDIFGAIHEYESDTLPNYRIESLEASVLLYIQREEFTSLIRQHPDFACQVVQVLEERQRVLQRRLESLMFKDVKQRVIETVLYLARFYSDKCRHGWAVDIRITQQDLADLVGATRQAVNKVMRELELKLYLSRKKRLVCIVSLKRLSKLVDKLNYDQPEDIPHASDIEPPPCSDE